MSIEPRPIQGRPFLDLFLISFVLLFFELACIRWFGSTVVFLTFFTNIVLMACFLGMSLGCLAASRPRDYITYVIPLLLLAVVLAYGVHLARSRGSVQIDVSNQRSPQQVYFGSEPRVNAPLTSFVIPIELVAGGFFTLIALMFVGLGQVMGRAFNAIPNRVAAYTVNVLGSLAGIVAFGLASYFWTTPLFWFAVCVSIFLYFLRPWSALQVGGALAVLFFIAANAYSPSLYYTLAWSPYYKVRYSPRIGVIETNGIGHQAIMSVSRQGGAYVLPHLLNRDAGGQPFRDVLIIGAGSGNDVQGALLNGVGHVDAVEIDPILNLIGRGEHPDKPFQDPRVTVHLDDGRSFVRKTSQKYDLIVYALVDSLVLHSGYSSLRLESFLFTEQAFRDIKAKLKPGGVFAMYNYYRQDWVIGRIARMARDVFGTEPLVISLPYQEEITPASSLYGFTFLLVGNGEDSAVDSIRKTLQERKSFWINEVPGHNFAINAYGPEPPTLAGVEPASWQKIAPSRINLERIDRIPTDDWPFLYLREPAIPALNLHSIGFIAGVSLILLFLFSPVRTVALDGRMFFLGAGFMLLETKGVVHMALLFGSTWIVNSFVFFAILVMILLSNLFVLIAKPMRLWPFYVLLILALAVNVYVPMETFLDLPAAARVVSSCAVVFAPIFFAGVIFAASFRDSPHPDIAFGSNIGGVILGGLSENLSLVLGFDRLLLVAIGFYLLSAVLGFRRVQAGSTPATIGSAVGSSPG
jgi:hypothetical protein